MSIQFVVHDPADSVGVIVVEEVCAGQQLSGWVMGSDEAVEVTTFQDIPIGHKVAMVDLEEGATLLKYGHDIGRTVAPIRRGEHVHVQLHGTRRLHVRGRDLHRVGLLRRRPRPR